MHCEPQEVDLLLIKWDTAAKALEIAEAAYEASELTTRPTALIGGCCCFGRTKVHATLSFCLPRMRMLIAGPETHLRPPTQPSQEACSCQDRIAARPVPQMILLQLFISLVVCGVKVDAINHWAKEVRELEAAIGEARQRALRSEPTGSFFVFFNDQRSAATAAQVCRLLSSTGRFGQFCQRTCHASVSHFADVSSIWCTGVITVGGRPAVPSHSGAS